MTTEQIEAVKDAAQTIINMERDLRRTILAQQNRISVALAYLKAGQPHLATLVLEGMEP